MDQHVVTCGGKVKLASIAIYDAGEKMLDRYTVFPWPRSRNPELKNSYLATSVSGGYSGWGEVLPRHQLTRRSALGKRIPFDKLPEETQGVIIRAIKPYSA